MKTATLKVKVTGTVPLVFHNGRLADPLDPWSKKLAELTHKRDKTDADLDEISHVEFLGGMYTAEFDGEERVIIPANVIYATLYKGAKKKKLGVLFKEGVYIEEDARLIFPDMDKTPEELWNLGYSKQMAVGRCYGHIYPAMVVVQRNRVRRTRPRFDVWSAEFTIVYYDDILNESQVKQLVIDAGDRIGFAEDRPKFGRFSVEFV